MMQLAAYLSIVTLLFLVENTSVVTGSNVSSLSVLSYNTFLASDEAARPERITSYLHQLRNGTFANTADVLCLQEVNGIELQENFTKAAREGGFTHRASFLDTFTATTSDRRACLDTAFSGITVCLLQHCSAQLAETLQTVNCAYTNCRSAIESSGITRECINCLVVEGNTGLYSGGVPSTRNVGKGTCFKQHAASKYRPEYGLLMLSKYPLKDVFSKAFLTGTSFFSRGYVRAIISGGSGVGDWTAVCTHLYPDVAGSSYIGDFSSAAVENLNNTEQVLTDSVVQATSNPVLLIGDLNTSPVLSPKDVSAAFPNSYKKFIDSSYCSPYATEVGSCTFCKKENVHLFNNPVHGNSSFIYDHIFLKAPFLNCSNGVGTSSVGATAKASREYFNNNNDSPLSDHYAVKLTMTFPNRRSAATTGTVMSSVTIVTALVATVLLFM